MHYTISPTKLEVYLETKKRRILVGVLRHDRDTKQFIFTYESDYLRKKTALAIGPELPLTRYEFTSEKNLLFPTFLDRIPDKQNPAYSEYCKSQGISPDETNVIILLGSIGHRGPSSFIYEAVYEPQGKIADELKNFRSELGLTQWDFAMLFDFPQLTIQKVEAGKTLDKNTLRLIDIFINQPKIALMQMKLTGKKVHREVRNRVYQFFKYAK